MIPTQLNIYSNAEFINAGCLKSFLRYVLRNTVLHIWNRGSREPKTANGNIYVTRVREIEFHRDAYWIHSYVQMSTARGCANFHTERQIFSSWILNYFAVFRDKSWLFQADYSKCKHPESYPFTGLDRPLRLQEFESPRICRQSSHKGGKFVIRMHRLPLPSGNIPGTHFC
jgi:hypothetical protein